MAALVSQRIHANFKWPDDPSTIGLTVEDTKALEIAISHLSKSLLPDTPARQQVADLFRKDVTITLSNGTKVPLPRRLIVANNWALVLLNSKGGIQPFERSGPSQRKIKWVYDAYSGDRYLKKRIHSIEESTLIQYIMAHQNQDLGFAKIVHLENHCGKMNYFERMYSSSLTELSRKAMKAGRAVPPVDVSSLLKFQNALHGIHGLKYIPPRLEFSRGSSMCFARNAHGSHGWHGDISPNNCVVEINSAGALEIRLIDYGFALQSDIIASLPGWNSPDAIQHMNYSNGSDVAAFNEIYAQKKDAWQFGLLVGSLMRGGPFFKPNCDIPLPRFSFIVDKIKVNEDGSINDADVIHVTQEEIDAELSAIFATVAHIQTPLTIWKTIQSWLQVDPNQRKSVYDTYLQSESPEQKNE